MIRELDVVVLKRDLRVPIPMGDVPGGVPTGSGADVRLKAGDVGTVVLIHQGGAGYELEFATLNGETLAVVTLPAEAVRSIGPREIAHARAIA